MQQKQARPDRVAIYVRWSTQEQSLGTTYEVQKSACEQFVKLHGWSVRDDLVFVDDGYSGTNLARPAITELRQRVQFGEVDCVVVHKLDRLSRNIVDLSDLVLREWDGKCNLCAVNEPFDTTISLGRLQFGILAVFAELEHGWIRERTYSGKLKRIQEGEIRVSMAAFGYVQDVKRGTWKEHPIESEVVRHISSLAAAGQSPAQIAQTLAALGKRSKAQRWFTAKTIAYILNNRVYIGEMVYGVREVKRVPLPVDWSSVQVVRRKYVIRHQRRKIPIVHVVSHAAPAIVPRELFELAQEKLADNRKLREMTGSRGMHSPHPVTGLLQCPCSASMVFTSPANPRYGYYVCSRRKSPKCPYQTRAKAGLADATVEGAFLAAFGTPSLRQAALGRRLADAEVDRAEISDVITRLRSCRSQVKEQCERVLESLAGTIDQHDDLVQLLQERVEKMDRLVETAERLLPQVEAEIQRAYRRLDTLDVDGSWHRLDIHQKRLLISSVLPERITVIRQGKGPPQLICQWELAPRRAIREVPNLLASAAELGFSP